MQGWSYVRKKFCQLGRQVLWLIVWHLWEFYSIVLFWWTESLIFISGCNMNTAFLWTIWRSIYFSQVKLIISVFFSSAMGVPICQLIIKQFLRSCVLQCREWRMLFIHWCERFDSTEWKKSAKKKRLQGAWKLKNAL